MSIAEWLFGLAFAGVSAVTIILLFRAWGEHGRRVKAELPTAKRIEKLTAVIAKIDQIIESESVNMTARRHNTLLEIRFRITLMIQSLEIDG